MKFMLIFIEQNKNLLAVAVRRAVGWEHELDQAGLVLT
jgi:hypothetical protein